MRLLEIKNDGFSLSEFFEQGIPRYAIISHTWGPNEEETNFEDIMNDTGKAKPSLSKLQFCGRQAEMDQLQYFWIDPCCIDKSSSAELSEAINSMFRWYQNSDRCYVYLSDVSKGAFEVDFPKSRWFTRGWTLQELIAPNDVNFFDRDWNFLGTKHDLGASISAIASIDRNVLHNASWLQYYSVAERMSWASSRNTTKVEDAAYCLLGIFDISIPLLYGEREKAFVRLQEEIIRKTSDDSILAWNLSRNIQDTPLIALNLSRGHYDSPLLADSPKHFAQCHGLKRGIKSDIKVTEHGVDINLPIVNLEIEENGQTKPLAIGVLSCRTFSGFDFIAIFMDKSPRKPSCFCRRFFFYGQHSVSTIMTSARVASTGTRRKLRLVSQDESASLLMELTQTMYTPIVVNRRPRLVSEGFEIQSPFWLGINAKNGNMDGLSSEYWKKDLGIFNLPWKRGKDYLFCPFRSHSLHAGFSLILWGFHSSPSSCMLCLLDNVLSYDEICDDVRALTKRMPQHSIHTICLPLGDRLVRISATAKPVMIYDTICIDVNIDLSDGTDVPEASAVSDSMSKDIASFESASKVVDS